jgi:hypothetical protein
MKEIQEAIMTKYSNDSAIVALTTGLHNTEAPQESVYPYIVFSYPSGIPDWTFSSDEKEFVIQFKIHDNNTSVVNVNLIYDALHTLFDWCSLTITGWHLTYMKEILEHLVRVDDKWQYVLQYRIRIQKD